MRPNSQETADLVIVTKKIHNGKLQFLCSEMNQAVLLGNLSVHPHKKKWNILSQCNAFSIDPFYATKSKLDKLFYENVNWRIKICQSFKQRAILKIPSTTF